MSSRKGLVTQAHRQALLVRKNAGYGIAEAVCIPDLVDRVGVEVRYVDIPSMEGAYLKQDNPVILLSSLRPPGRQNFTCAHELGHHVFGHGTCIDEIIEPQNRRAFQTNEFLVDAFAGMLLMPKSAVNEALKARQIDPDNCLPDDLYRVSEWLGVGYGTLLHHMSTTLGIIGYERAQLLKRTSPKSIRARIMGDDCPQHLIPVDFNWLRRAVDIQVGDLISAPSGILCEGMSANSLYDNGQHTVLRGEKPGISRLYDPATDWSAFVRTSRRGFVGRAVFRHLEEADES